MAARDARPPLAVRSATESVPFCVRHEPLNRMRPGAFARTATYSIIGCVILNFISETVFALDVQIEACSKKERF